MHLFLSCLLNTVLLGNPKEPLCSRVYRQPPSPYRTHYLILMDIIFQEQDHCLRIHAEFIINANATLSRT